MNLKLSENEIRSIIRNEIKTSILEQVSPSRSAEDQAEVDALQTQLDAGAITQEEFDDAVREIDEAAAGDDLNIEPASGASGAEEEEEAEEPQSETPAAAPRSRSRSYSQVADMQRIFMGQEGDADPESTTPNLHRGDDGRWGSATQAAWIKFLRKYLNPEDFARVGERSPGDRVAWSGAGSDAASQILDTEEDDKTFSGRPQGALDFVRALIARGVVDSAPEAEPEVAEEEPASEPAEEPAEETMAAGRPEGEGGEGGAASGPDTASGDPDARVRIPINDNDGQVAFYVIVPNSRKGSIRTDRSWLGRLFGPDSYVAVDPSMTRRGGKGYGGDTLGDFTIRWGQTHIEPGSSSSTVFQDQTIDFSNVRDVQFEDNVRTNSLPRDSMYRQVIRQLKDEQRLYERERYSEIPYRDQWDGAAKGGMLLRKLLNRQNRYQRLTIILGDGNRRVMYRPHPRKHALDTSNDVRAFSDKWLSMGTTRSLEETIFRNIVALSKKKS